MLLPVWLALALLLVAVTAGTALVFLRARAFWRDLKSFGAALDGAVSGLTRSADRLAAGSEQVASALPRLEAHTARLRASLARLAVLRAAVQDVRDAVGAVTAFVPRK